MSEPLILVAMPVEAGTSCVPGSTIALCARCGLEVWQAPSSTARRVQAANARIVCLPCLPAVMREQGDDEITLEPTTAAQRAEILAWLRGRERRVT